MIVLLKMPSNNYLSKLLLLVLLFSWIENSSACRIKRLSMQEYIELSELIVVGDTYAKVNQEYMIVRKVLKGNKRFKGKTIHLNDNSMHKGKIVISCSDGYPPVGEKNIALFLTDDWKQTSDTDRYIKYYTESKDIKALKHIISISAIKDESKRLKKIMKYALREPLGNTQMQQHFLAETKNLKNPESLAVVLKYFEQTLEHFEKLLNKETPIEKVKLAEDYIVDLIQLLEEIADTRTVPELIKALNSSSEAVRSHVSDTLYFKFPGVPGVTEAFIKYRNTAGVHEMAANYLGERFNYNNPKPRTPHPWYTANQLIKSKQLNAAKAILHQQLLTKKATFSDRLFTANKLLSIADNDDREFIIKNLLPEIETELNKGISLTVDDMVEVLSDLKHPATLPLLLKVLSMHFTQLSHEEALLAAVFAINDLGMEAIEQGEAVILNRLKSKYKEHISTCCRDLKFLLALLWLNSEKVEQPHVEMFSDRFYGQIKNIAAVSLAANEAGFMHDALINQADIHPEVNLWVTRRLSYLKDEQGIPLLVNFLAENDDRSYIYQPALISIGGEAAKKAIVAKAMLGLFTHPKKWVRTTAITVYARLAEKEILPYLREMTLDKDYGDLDSALVYFYYYGTPEDLPYLNKNCNFWNAENERHYLACHARYGIWSRYDYDLSGPIKKVSGPPR